MSDVVTYCASGCKVTGQHRGDCPGETCKGCQPRQADHGTLCAWCAQRLAIDLAQVPALVAHLREIGKPYAQMQPASDSTAHTDPAETTVLPAAWLAADEMTSTIDSWAHVMLEEHPANLRGPHAAPWHGDVVAWMLPHIDWILRQEWACEMRRELSRDVSTFKARWPTLDMTEPERHVTTPCPRCQMLSLTYAPPSFHRQPFKVSCSNPDCARVFSEDEWDRFKALALDVRRTA
ncbi:MAG: hypothetical protein M0Z51_16670 [Propionibacterium sp.]|nr:hypothetical protein [Propionibacterium sp.]